MTLDAQPRRKPAHEADSAARPPLWQRLAPRRQAAPAAAGDVALGYESALPWTLADAAGAEDGQPAY